MNWVWSDAVLNCDYARPLARRLALSTDGFDAADPKDVKAVLDELNDEKQSHEC